MPSETVTEPARLLPVSHEADVVVVGAGPGGFAAALQAARMGAKVVLVERYDMPGGVHTSGLQGSAGPGVGGIHSELMERFAAAGHIYSATHETHPDWAGNPLSHYERYLKPDASFVRQSFNADGAGHVMSAMLEEAGVTTLYGASFVDVILKSGINNDSIQAIVVESASGRHAIAGRIFIEGSGTAQVAAAAGVPFVRGGGGQPEGADWDGVERPIPGGLLWTMHGVDYGKIAAHQRDAKDPALQKTIAEARAARDIPDHLYRPPMGGRNVYGSLYIGHPTVDMNPIGPDSFILWQNVPYEWALRMDESGQDDARARRELRALIEAEAAFLRKYVPGFETASISNVGRFVGVRDGRHPVGEHVFSIEDVRANRRFADAVTKPMTKPFYWDSHARYTFEVSFRSFLPKKIDNLILTGASLSFGYDTIFMVMRNFPWCIQTGEIAGYAAARCIDHHIKPKELEWRTPYF